MFRALSAMSFLMTKTLLRRLHMLMWPNAKIIIIIITYLSPINGLINAFFSLL